MLDGHGIEGAGSRSVRDEAYISSCCLFWKTLSSPSSAFYKLTRSISVFPNSDDEIRSTQNLAVSTPHAKHSWGPGSAREHSNMVRVVRRTISPNYSMPKTDTHFPFLSVRDSESTGALKRWEKCYVSGRAERHSAERARSFQALRREMRRRSCTFVL